MDDIVKCENGNTVPAKTVVRLRRGVVYSVVSTVKQDVLVVDYDTDGQALDTLFADEDRDPCKMYTEVAGVEPETVATLFESYGFEGPDAEFEAELENLFKVVPAREVG